MRLLPAPLLALLCADVARAREFVVRAERLRSYGGEAVVAQAEAPDGVRRLLWEASVAGAPVERGEVLVLEDGRAVLSARAPGVKRACDMTIRMQAAGGLMASCVVRVFPAYDGSRLRRLCASARLGVAEVEDEVSSRLARFDCRFERAGSRLALSFFDGDVILASGAWWASEGRLLKEVVREKLGRGARTVVLEAVGGGPYLGAEGKRAGGGARGVVLVDGRHPLSSHAGLLEGWSGVPPLNLATEPPVNLCRVAIDATTERPVIAQVFPPEGGALLVTSLPIISRFERDPAAPILFERCLAWAVDFEPPEWKEAAFCLAGADEVAGFLTGLGVKGAKELPDENGIVLVAAGGLTDEVRDWITFGGTAAVLVPGSCAAPPGSIADDPATRGLSAGLVKRLRAPAPDDDAWELPALGGKRRALVAGFLDRVELGEGKAYVLRVGPLDDEMTRPWREFLLQVLTNLGVRCGEVDADE